MCAGAILESTFAKYPGEAPGLDFDSSGKHRQGSGGSGRPWERSGRSLAGPGRALGGSGGALGELWEALRTNKLRINRPSGRYVIYAFEWGKGKQDFQNSSFLRADIVVLYDLII